MSLLLKCVPTEMCYSREPKINSRYPISIQDIEFYPPKPSHYTIELDEGNRKSINNCYQKVKFVHEVITEDNIPSWIKVTCYCLSTGKNNKIVALHVQNMAFAPKGEENLTMIYSHEDRSDLGSCYTKIIDLSIQLKIDIISYDYTGYGQSFKKSPSFETFTNDIGLVLDLAIKELKIKKENLLFYGEEIGIVPSVLICSKVAFRKAFGMILVSLLLIKEIVNGLFKCIKCPVYIIHGKKINNSDQIRNVCEQFKNKYSWYPQAKTTNDIIVKRRHKYYFRIRDFIRQVKSLSDLSCPPENGNLSLEFQLTCNIPFDHEDEKSDLSNKKSSTANLLSQGTTNHSGTPENQVNQPDLNGSNSDLSYDGSL